MVTANPPIASILQQQDPAQRYLAHSAPLLEMCNVAFAYRDTRVIRDFNLTMKSGEHRLLIGPSGSGKSTLVNLICGFVTPDSGKITIGGALMSATHEATRDAIRRDHIALVFQSLRLVSALDIAGNLALAARLARKPAAPAVIAALLEELSIAYTANKRPSQLSQGEAQRAAIARALIVAPKLLIADEPTSALDHANTDTVARLLLKLADTHGTSLLIATHDDRLRPYFANTIDLAKMPQGHAR